MNGRAGAAQHPERAQHQGGGRGEDPERRAVPGERGDRERGGRVAGAASADAAFVRYLRGPAVLLECFADVADAVC